MAAKLPAAQKAERDMALFRLKLLHPSWTWDQLCVHLRELNPKWALGREAVRKIHKEMLDSVRVEITEAEKLEIFSEHIAGLRDLRSILGEQIEACQGGAKTVTDETTGKPVQIIVGPNPAAIIGAVRAIAALRHEEITLQQHAGLLPKNLGQFAIELNVSRTVEIFMHVMEQHLPPKQLRLVKDDLIEELRESRRREIAAPSEN
jgi:hypothetical protein